MKIHHLNYFPHGRGPGESVVLTKPEEATWHTLPGACFQVVCQHVAGFTSPGPRLRMRQEPAWPCSCRVRSIGEHEQRPADFCAEELGARGGAFTVTCLRAIFRMSRCQRPHESVTFLTVNFMFQHIKISKEKKLAFNVSPSTTSPAFTVIFWELYFYQRSEGGYLGPGIR